MRMRILMWSSIVMLPLCFEEPNARTCGNDLAFQEQADDLANRLSRVTAIKNPTEEQIHEVTDVTQQLRALGPTGLAATLRVREAEPQTGDNELQLRLLDQQLDLIAGQKNSRTSKLYWYKALAVAKAKSTELQRPILSLRLLGQLDEDMSCANSRFFRRILYTNPQIADLLRQHFILHWQPVRDVPIATINFGNGRKLEQPIVGNSVHLAVTKEGRVIDALPGLVTPVEFLDWAQSILVLHHRYLSLPSNDFQQHLQGWHQNRAQLRRQQSEVTIGVGQKVSELNPIDPRWKLAAKKMKRTAMHPIAKQLKNGNPTAAAAMITAPLKMAAELPLFRMVDSLDPRTEEDSFFNLYGLQPKLDDWYARDASTGDYDALTNRIYEELFLMPLNDPWLGLSPGDRFIALDSREPDSREPDGNKAPNPPTKKLFDAPAR